jgi:hypothetical protein
MSKRYPYPPARKNDKTAVRPLDDRIPSSPPQAGLAERACCCPARAMVQVTMPPSPARPHETTLLLCGHHSRVSRPALAAAGARLRDLPVTS